jgi:hypothetical protein
MQEQEYEFSMILVNTRAVPLTLNIEPWGWAYEMEPKTKYTICFRSNIQPIPPNIVETEYAENYITVCAWDGCRFAIYQNGEVLHPGAFAGPRLPGGVQAIKSIGFLNLTRDMSGK